MDLFDFKSQSQTEKRGPLANRMRPQTLEDFIGQTHIVENGTLLYRAIKADQLTPMIFYGPPGTGKTTLAKIIARTTEAHFEQLNAVTSGISDIRTLTEAASERLKMENERTVLFIDEIHRFNKSQQDALLPHVEQGTIVLIGATTESPMFEINDALLSRSRLFRFKPLTDEAIKNILINALQDENRGYGRYSIELHDEALHHLVNVAGGDARTALNALELAVLTTDPNQDGSITIDLQTAEESIQERVLQYDKNGDNHYDTISAFIKSVRGSDPDASLYWLAKMLYAGEDPRFIARRLYVHAAEDIGMADPNALLIAEAAARAVDYIGMPEVRLPLAEATIYLATAPKSNGVIKAIDTAMDTVKREKTGGVPPHLRDTHYHGASTLGHGKGYQYPHHHPNGYVPQQYMPDHLRDKTFYHPTERGYEKTVQKRLHYWQQRDQQTD